jgi:hypothetical protein
MNKIIDGLENDLVDYMMNLNHSTLVMIVTKFNAGKEVIEEYNQLRANYRESISKILDNYTLNFYANVLCVEINGVIEMMTFSDKERLDSYLKYLEAEYEKVSVIFIK